MRFLAMIALFIGVQAQAAWAQDVRVHHMVDCPDQSGIDKSFVIKTAVPVAPCRDSYRVAYAIHDTRFGVVYWLGVPSFIPLTKEVVEPDTVDLSDTMTSCLTSIGNGAIVDEWLVAHGTSCKGRMPGSAYWRRYTPKLVCLMPQVTCVGIEELRPDAQDRAHKVLERAREQSVSRLN